MFVSCDLLNRMKHQQNSATADKKPSKSVKPSKWGPEKNSAERNPILSAHLASLMKAGSSSSGAGSSGSRAASYDRVPTPELQAPLVEGPLVDPTAPFDNAPSPDPLAAQPAPADLQVELNAVQGGQDGFAQVLEYGLNLQLQVRGQYSISDDLSVVWGDTAWVVFSSPDIRVNVTQMQHDLHVDGGKLIGALCRLGHTQMRADNGQVIMLVEKSPAAVAAVNDKLTGIVFHASRPQ